MARSNKRDTHIHNSQQHIQIQFRNDAYNNFLFSIRKGIRVPRTITSGRVWIVLFCTLCFSILREGIEKNKIRYWSSCPCWAFVPNCILLIASLKKKTNPSRVCGLDPSIFTETCHLLGADPIPFFFVFVLLFHIALLILILLLLLPLPQ